MQNTNKSETTQEREYKRLYLNRSAERDNLKATIISAIAQLENGVMAGQVAQQLKNAIK